MKIIPIKRAEEMIPHGIYCYTPLQEPSAETNFAYRIKSCPFWERYEEAKHGKLPEDYSEGEQHKGAFCKYLKLGDWNGADLLWDQVKECGIKTDEAFFDIQ